MIRTAITLALAAVVLALPGRAAAQSAFPAATPGAAIGGGLPTGFEASGLAWVAQQNALYSVGDNGVIARMTRTGTVTNTWSVPGNLEAIAVAQPASPFVYVANENTGQVYEFNTAAGSIARTFDLTTATAAVGVTPLTAADKQALVGAADNKGTEALTFLPIAGDPQGGIFLAGSQENGRVYKFRLSLDGGSAATYLGRVKNWTYTDLSDLTYDATRGKVMALFDNENRLLQLDADLNLEATYLLPSGADWEGVAADGDSLFLCQDDGNHTVTRYDAFQPVPEPGSLTFLGAAAAGGWIATRRRTRRLPSAREPRP